MLGLRGGLMSKAIRFRNGVYLDASSIVLDRQLLKNYIDGKWVNIKDQTGVFTNAIDDLEIFFAVAKKSGGIRTINIIARTLKGIPNAELAACIKIPQIYAPTNTITAFCRTNGNYTYPQWNDNSNERREHMAFMYITVDGSISVRTYVPNQKVINILLTY